MTRLERLEPSEEALFNDVGAEACRVTQSRRAGKTPTSPDCIPPEHDLLRVSSPRARERN